MLYHMHNDRRAPTTRDIVLKLQRPVQGGREVTVIQPGASKKGGLLPVLASLPAADGTLAQVRTLTGLLYIYSD